MAEKLIARVQDTVRVVRLNAKRDAREVLYGRVIAVAAAFPENLGTSKEPTVTVSYVDPVSFDPNAASSADWQKIHTRQTGVRHATHADVQNGVSDFFYVDVLPRDGVEFDLEELNLTDLTKPVVEAPKPGDEDYTKPIFSSNDYDVMERGEDKFEIVRQGEPVKGDDGKDLDSFDSLDGAKAWIAARPVKVANMAPATPTTELTQSEAFAKGAAQKTAAKAQEETDKAREQEKAAEGRSAELVADSTAVEAADPANRVDTRTDSQVQAENPDAAHSADGEEHRENDGDSEHQG